MTSFLDTSDALASFIEQNRTRTVSAGLDPAQYALVTQELKSLREWRPTFHRIGREHSALAEGAEAEGRTVSAGEAYHDAALWFHFATIVPDPDQDALADSATEADEAMRRSLAHLDPAAERIEEPTFVGVLRRPAATRRPPVVIVIPGMDSGKEEFSSITDALLRRGLATLAIDGPGQGVLAASSAPEVEYEKVIHRIVDVLRGRTDLAGERVATLGLSLGGYYNAVAAAHEPRLRAAVSVTGGYALDWDHLPPFVTETLTLRTGGEDAARAFARRFRWTDIAERIRCPLRVLDGALDVIPGVTNGAGLARRAPYGEYVLVPGGDHLLANTRWTWLPETADRLADRLVGA